MFEPLERSHGLAILAAGSDATARAQLAEEHARLEAASRDLDRLDGEVGPALQVSDQWHALRSRLMHPSVEPGALVTETRRLIAYVGDRSRMFLDPDLDSYYLIDAVLTQLPRLAERLSVEGAALVEQAATGERALARPADVLAALGLARSEREALDRGHAVAFSANPGLRPVLEPSLGATWDAVEALASMVSRATREVAGPPTRPAREVYGLYERALGDLFAHHGAASAALDHVLQARVRRLSRHRALLLALVSSALAVVAYLWLGFYVAVKRAVTALDAVSRRMATGDFTGPVGVESRDELRLVVDAFNEVAARLRTEWARAQEEAARARLRRKRRWRGLATRPRRPRARSASFSP